MNRLSHFKLAGLVAALSIFLGACATGPPDELQKARHTYEQAKQTEASQYAPTELQQARQALIRAERAFQEGGADETTRTLSYVALREAQAAMAKGRVNYLADQHEQRQSELFARTESARRQYRKQAIRERHMREMTTQQLEQQQEQRERELERMQAELEEQEVSDEQFREQERQLEQAIERLEEEIDQRQQAEQRLNEAMDRLDEIAEVRREDGRGRIVTLDNQVLFELGKSELRPQSRQQLSQVADILKAQDQARFVIEGHTDSKGSEQLNERLSRERAQAVRDFLIDRGVNRDQVQTRGYGEARPVASNESPEGRAMNRRVEIVIQTPDEAVGGGPDAQDQQPMEQPDEQPMEQPDEQPMEQPDEQPMEQPEDMEPMEQPEDMEPMDQSEDMEPMEQPEDMEPMDQPEGEDGYAPDEERME